MTGPHNRQLLPAKCKRIAPTGSLAQLFSRFAALALLLGLAAGAQAATSIWSNTVGGFPTWYGSPSFGSNVYTLSAPLPTWPPYTLGNQQHLRIVVPASGTNTAAATLNVASTGALPIVTNAESGLSALVGGELVAGLEYDLTYSTSSASACSNSCYVLSWLAGSPVLPGTTQTVAAAVWASVGVYQVTTAAQTLTLPASSGLNPNGGIFIQTIGQSVTLQAGGSDTINGGSAGGSIVLPAGIMSLVTTNGSGALYAAPSTSGGGGTVTSVGLAAGLTDTAGTCNTGGQAITTSGTVYPQNCVGAYTSNHTVAAADGVQLYTTVGALGPVQFTLPSPSANKGFGWCFTDGSGNGFTVAPFASESFYGSISGTSLAFAGGAKGYVCVSSDGTNWADGATFVQTVSANTSTSLAQPMLNNGSVLYRAAGRLSPRRQLLFQPTQ